MVVRTLIVIMLMSFRIFIIIVLSKQLTKKKILGKIKEKGRGGGVLQTLIFIPVVNKQQKAYYLKVTFQLSFTTEYALLTELMY